LIFAPEVKAACIGARDAAPDADYIMFSTTPVENSVENSPRTGGVPRNPPELTKRLIFGHFMLSL
jgi:hypothetical protein